MRIRVGLSACLATTLAVGLAHAEGDSNGPAPGSLAKPTRRSDFTIGATGVFSFGRASGYPNKVDQIDNRAYRSNTKMSVGSGGLLWLGVAFNDYLTFGLGMGQYTLTGNDRTARAGLFAFHVDAYPLFSVDKNLQDLGVFANVGTGPLEITGGRDKAEGGLMSFLEGGVAYERLRFWRFGFGPSASVTHMWSQSATMTGALVGLRLAFYSGP
jgi:hypothetical protein